MSFLRAYSLIALLLLGFATSSHAQWSVGIRGGPNLPNDEMMLPTATAAHTKPIIGGVVAYQFNNWLSVEAQPQYLQKGQTLGAPFFASDLSLETTELGEWLTPAFTYVEVPIIVKFETHMGDLGLNTFVGISPALLLSGKAHVQRWEGDGLMTTETRDYSHRMLPYDIAWDYGLGLSYDLSSRFVLVADIRQSVGVVNVLEEESGDPQFLGKDSQYYYRSLDVKIIGGLMYRL